MTILNPKRVIPQTFVLWYHKDVRSASLLDQTSHGDPQAENDCLELLPDLALNVPVSSLLL